MFNEYASLFEFLQKQNTKVYLVGGAVRDILMNQPSHDLDFVVLGDASHLARMTANHLHGAYYLMDEEHGIARVLIDTPQFTNLVLDFSDARGGSLESDLKCRDFTVNAIALDLTAQKIIDPLEGSVHLRQKVLKICNPESFIQDPIRVLRAIRFSLYLNLRIEPETKSLLYQAMPYLPGISGERQRDELIRMLGGGKSAAAVRVLHHTGILNLLLPEVGILLKDQQTSPVTSYSVDLPARTLQNADMILDFIEGKRDLIPENLYSNLIFLHWGRFRQRLLHHLQNHLNADRSLRGLICLAGLFFPAIAGQTIKPYYREPLFPQTDSLIERLKFLAFSKAEIQYFQKIITNANLFFDLLDINRDSPARDNDDLTNPAHHLGGREIYRYFKTSGEAGIDICLLSLALFGAQSGYELNQKEYTRLLEIVDELFEGYWEHNPQIIHPQPLITGDDIMKNLSIQAGEKVGQILEMIKEEQAAGNIQTQQQAFDFARTILNR